MDSCLILDGEHNSWKTLVMHIRFAVQVKWVVSQVMNGKPGRSLTNHWHHVWYCHPLGLISREEAETMLSEEPPHSYLVRVSEKIWGYAISYKADGRCKHYLVDTTDYGYQFFGTNQLEHSSLSQLIQYHKVCALCNIDLHASFQRSAYLGIKWDDYVWLRNVGVSTV